MKYYAVHTDQLGTPQVITDENKQVVWEADRDPFGKVTNVVTNNFAMNVALPGQYSDAETNYNQNWNRDYDPNTGRYLQSDPIGLRGGVNTYIYANANPVNWSDPMGLWTFSLVGASSFQNGAVGTTSSTGPVIGSTPNGGFAVCWQTTICVNSGAGLDSSKSVSGTFSTDTLTCGDSGQGGIFAEGGDGPTHLGISKTADGNNSTTTVSVGGGEGLAGGGTYCMVHTSCR